MKNSVKATALLISIIIWGLSYPLVKILLDRGVPPVTLATIRHVVFLPMLIFLFLRKRLTRYSQKDYLIFAILAFFTIFLPNVSQNMGMQYTSASLAGIIQSTSPVFTIVLAFVFLKESKTFSKILGSVIALIGTIFLVSGGNLEFNLSVYGNLLILISSISYAISGVILKRALSRIDAFDLLCFETFFGFIMLLLSNIFIEDMRIISSFDPETWMYLIILSIFASFAAAILYYKVLSEEELSYLIIFTYLIPVFAVIFSYYMLNETFGFETYIFATVTILGVIIAQIDHLRSKTFGFIPR